MGTLSLLADLSLMTLLAAGFKKAQSKSRLQQAAARPATISAVSKLRK